MELSKQEMELLKQEMELFHPLPDLWSKNLFYQMSLIFSKEFIIDFQNRKWNYPKRKWNYLNRKWNYFTHFQISDQKTYFTKCISFSPRSSKLICKTGNAIIQTGNGIISPTSRPLVKKFLLQHILHINQGVQNWFAKQGMELFRQEME